MIRQLSSAGPCKYLHNYDKKFVKFLLEKERGKKVIERQVFKDKQENAPHFNNRNGVLFCFKYLGDFCKKN